LENGEQRLTSTVLQTDTVDGRTLTTSGTMPLAATVDNNNRNNHTNHSNNNNNNRVDMHLVVVMARTTRMEVRTGI